MGVIRRCKHCQVAYISGSRSSETHCGGCQAVLDDALNAVPQRYRRLYIPETDPEMQERIRVQFAADHAPKETWLGTMQSLPCNNLYKIEHGALLDSSEGDIVVLDDLQYMYQRWRKSGKETFEQGWEFDTATGETTRWRNYRK